MSWVDAELLVRVTEFRKESKNIEKEAKMRVRA